MKAKLKKVFNKKNFERLFFDNKTVLFFIIGGVLNGFLLRAFTLKNYFAISPFLGDLLVLLVISALSFLVRGKNQRWFLIFWALIFALVSLINSVYFTFYNSFASASLISIIVYAAEVSDAITENVIKVTDFIYLLYPIIIFAVGLKWKPGKKTHLLEYRKRNFLNFSVITGVMFLLFLTGLTPKDISRFHNQWNREYLVSKYGIYIYQGNDVIKSIQPKLSSVFGYDQALKEYREYYDENSYENVENDYTGIFEGKNIITIHAESIQQFLMDTSFNGIEVTPNLNRIASEGLYFSNFYSQVSVGTSSDSEFTLNTSLFPSSNGTVFVSYFTNEYLTIPDMLNELGYDSYSFHANNCGFWNRETMHSYMGYDNFYCKPDYEVLEENVIGLGLSDEEFFKQTVPKLLDITESSDNPFYATLIMLSNHTPFSEVEKYGEYPVNMTVTITNEDGEKEEVTWDYMEGTKLGNYFKSSHYADYAIGVLFDELEAAGILDDTVIVIYGDHDARLSKSDYRLFYNFDPETGEKYATDDERYTPVDYYEYELNRKVPFIIWSSDLKKPKEITEVMGMIDILPTLGNMFGFESKYALGTDMMDETENMVVFPNGNWLTDKVYYYHQKGEYKLLVDEPLDEDYIETQDAIAKKKLEVASDIILYDLIKIDNEQQELLNEISK